MKGGTEPWDDAGEKHSGTGNSRCKGPGAGMCTCLSGTAGRQARLEHREETEAGEMGPGLNRATQWARPGLCILFECDCGKLWRVLMGWGEG